MIKMHKFVSDRAGANLVEYIILVGVVALLAIGGFTLFGNSVKDKIKEQADTVGGIGM